MVRQGSNLIAQSAGKPAAGGSNQNDAASSSQVWITGANMNERGTNPDPSFQECARKLAAEKFRHQRRGRLEVAALLPHISCQRSTPRASLLELATTTQAQARRQNGGPRCEYADMENVYDCHSAIGNDNLENSHSTKNQPQRTVKQLFDVTRKLIRDQTEIQGVSMINWQENSWTRTTLLTDLAVLSSTAKAYEFSYSELCMGRINENSVKAWKGKIDWLMNSSQCRELDRIDGESMELEWTIFPGFTALQILRDPEHDD